MIRIRAMTAADIPAGQRLREQAGWNQTVADWRRLLAWDAAGCWVAEHAGEVVGTTAVTSYGQRIAWVGMVLVDEAHRRQGIGQALLTHALAYLERRGVQTIALDSTPAGQPLYARLGFEDAFELARWRGPFPTLPTVEPQAAGGDLAPGVGAPDVRPLLPADLPSLAAYDARLFGTDRAHILGALLADPAASCAIAERDGQVTGYALSRPGARAWHLGPLAADDPQTAMTLVQAALAAVTLPADAAAGRPPGGAARPSELVMDVVMTHAAARQLAHTLGLTLVRPFIRMTRGAAPPVIDAARLYTSAGPELG